ncbi:hypothetical protein BD410DRAFT_688542, partial [Rickenella mellea]
KGSVFAVKSQWCENPYCEERAIVVNYVGDLFQLGQGSAMYPAQWNRSVPASATSAGDWFKEEGNSCYKETRYRTAVLRYTEALNFEPHKALKIAIYSNRAQAHLASGGYEAAIADAHFVLSVEPQHEKALFRTARAHYAMSNYTKAIELLESIIQVNPSSESVKSELRRAKQRLVEQSTGAYDFDQIGDMAAGPYPCMDVASYLGPVEQGDPVNRNPGLFATRDIQAGELLLCTKVFEFLYANVDHVRFYNRNSTSFGSTSTLRLSRKIAQKLLSNPTFIAPFMQLHRYSTEIVGHISTVLVDGRPVVDDFLIASLLNTHAFAMSCNHGDAHKYSGVGVCTTPSHVSHHCLGNCSRTVVGDLVIYRASRDMAMGDEIRAMYASPYTPVAERQESLLEMHNISCTCLLCERQLAETHDDRRERYALNMSCLMASMGHVPQNPDTIAAVLEKFCADMESTYSDPPDVQPRFLYIEKLVSLAICYVKARNMQKLLETSLRVLSSLGF